MPGTRPYDGHAALAEEARVGAADADRRGDDGLRQVRLAGLLERLEQTAVPRRGRPAARPASDHLEGDARVVDHLLDVRDERALVGVRQQAAVEAHLRLLGDDVDLVAAAEHRQADRVVQQRLVRALRGDLPPRRLAAQAADHLGDRRALAILGWLLEQRVRGAHQPVGGGLAPGHARRGRARRAPRAGCAPCASRRPRSRTRRRPRRSRVCPVPPSSSTNAGSRSAKWFSTIQRAPIGLPISSSQVHSMMTSRVSSHVAALQQQHGHQLHDAHALVVQRAAAVDVAVGDLARVRIEAPVGGDGLDHVHVVAEQQRLADGIVGAAGARRG